MTGKDKIERATFGEGLCDASSVTEGGRAREQREQEGLNLLFQQTQSRGNINPFTRAKSYDLITS